MILERDCQIFVSYRRIGGEYAAQYLKTELSNMGYRVFLDVQDLCDGDFSKNIEKAIGQCRVLLVILSEGIFRNTLKNPEKDWIIKEYAVMKERKQNQEDVKIIPVRLRNYQEPDKEEIRQQAEHLPEDGGILQKKKECLNNLIELLHCNYIPFTDTRYSGAVLNRLILWMQLKPADEEELRKKAENNPAAMNELGMMYECGNVAGSGRDGLKEAYQYYRKAESYGDACPAAVYNLGDIYEKCSENPALLEEYGMDDYKGRDIPGEEIVEDLKERAVQCYQKSAGMKPEGMENGYLPALYRLGNLSEDRGEYEKAFEYYKTAADSGYPYACNALGFFYRNGIGHKENEEKAQKYYEKAQMAGVPEGRYNYARIKEKSALGESIQNYEQLISEGAGNPMLAFYALASCYEKKADCSAWEEQKWYLGKAMEDYRQAYNYGHEQAGIDLERCRGKYLGVADNEGMDGEDQQGNTGV